MYILYHVYHVKPILYNGIFTGASTTSDVSSYMVQDYDDEDGRKTFFSLNISGTPANDVSTSELFIYIYTVYCNIKTENDSNRFNIFLSVILRMTLLL